MDREFLTDEDIHALDEDDEITVLRNKLSKANEKIEELEDKINTARLKLELDNKINERCLSEEIDNVIKKTIELEIKHNNELLDILKSDE